MARQGGMRPGEGGFKDMVRVGDGGGGCCCGCCGSGGGVVGVAES